MPTIKDVANAAGVSIATVSYVLNNRIEMVSAETRLHVLEKARQLGYRPNITARNLQSSRTRLIGYAWTHAPGEEPNWIMEHFLYNLAQSAEAAKYHLLTFTYPSHDPVSVYEDLIRSGRVDAIVITETNENDQRIKYLVEQGFPFVSFGRSTLDLSFPWIDTDGREGMKVATQHLIDLGHRRIAFMGWPGSSLTGNFRMNGYLDALLANDLPRRKDYIIQSDYAGSIIENTFSHWDTLPQDEQPTAVVCVADYVAISAMRVAEQHGHVVGKTLSVVGFDDAPMGKYMRPALSTLRQPLLEITNALINTLDEILTSETGYVCNELFVPQLIIRDSSGPPINR